MNAPERIMLGTWGLVMVIALVQLYKWHMAKDDFDLRLYITSPNAQGVERPDLSKLLLVIAMVASTYALIRDASDAAGAQPELLAIYLGAWVLNKAVSMGGRVLPTMFGKGAPPPAQEGH